MNNFNGIGRLTRDPEMRYTQNGDAVCSFSIAIDKGLSKEKKQEWESQGKATADFINIVTWRGTAEFAANYLKKGQLVGITGSLQSGQYEKDGITRYTTDINCNNITMIDWGDKKENTGDYQGNQDFHPVANDDVPF